MRYVSTRAGSPAVGFSDALVAGLAPDGGLYVPDAVAALPPPDPEAPYVAVAKDVIGGFVDRDVDSLIEDAYAAFDHPDVCPVVELSDGLWVQELWHGPTLAFKDVALQLVGRLFDQVLGERERPGDDRGGDLRRHRLRGHRGVRRTGGARHRRAAPRGPGERGAAPHDDERRLRPTCTTWRSRAPSTTARTW